MSRWQAQGHHPFPFVKPINKRDAADILLFFCTPFLAYLSWRTAPLPEQVVNLASGRK
jgi:hypothetical protein